MSSELLAALGVGAGDAQQIRVLPPGEQPRDGVYIIAWKTMQDNGECVYATVKGEIDKKIVGQTFPVYGEPLRQPVVDPDCHWTIERVDSKTPGPNRYLITSKGGIAFNGGENLFTGLVTPTPWSFIENDETGQGNGFHAQYMIEECNSNPPRYWAYLQPLVAAPPENRDKQIQVVPIRLGVTGYIVSLIYLGPINKPKEGNA